MAFDAVLTKPFEAEGEEVLAYHRYEQRHFVESKLKSVRVSDVEDREVVATGNQHDYTHQHNYKQAGDSC